METLQYFTAVYSVIVLAWVAWCSHVAYRQRHRRDNVLPGGGYHDVER
jgi:hypothetical protein